MKKIILVLICVYSTQVFSQLQGTTSTVSTLNARYYDDFANTDASGKVLKYEDITGTPYIDIAFKKAIISEEYPYVFIRYNAYKDEIEFKSEETLMVLPKDQQFNRIEILSPKEVLVYKTIEGNTDGYYYELVNGKTSLYKKMYTKFTDFKKATSPYAQDSPPIFKAQAPEFYIVAENKVIKNPRKEKEIIEVYSDKKNELKSFFKQNKIKFDEEQSLIRLVRFLNK